jgi:hypothetical protein
LQNCLRILHDLTAERVILGVGCAFCAQNG